MLTHEKNINFGSREMWICNNCVTLGKLLNFFLYSFVKQQCLYLLFWVVASIRDSASRTSVPFLVHKKNTQEIAFLFKTNFLFHKPILRKLYQKGYINFCLCSSGKTTWARMLLEKDDENSEDSRSAFCMFFSLWYWELCKLILFPFLSCPLGNSEPCFISKISNCVNSLD